MALASWLLLFFWDWFYEGLLLASKCIYRATAGKRTKEHASFWFPVEIHVTRDLPRYLIHNFQNNHFKNQIPFDNGKRSYFTAFFCNNNNIYSPQSTRSVRWTTIVAEAVLVSSTLFVCI